MSSLEKPGEEATGEVGDVKEGEDGEASVAADEDDEDVGALTVDFVGVVFGVTVALAAAAAATVDVDDDGAAVAELATMATRSSFSRPFCRMTTTCVPACSSACSFDMRWAR